MFWLQRAGIVKIGAPPFPPVSVSEKMNKRKEKSRGQEDGQGDLHAESAWPWISEEGSLQKKWTFCTNVAVNPGRTRGTTRYCSRTALKREAFWPLDLLF